VRITARFLTLPVMDPVAGDQQESQRDVRSRGLDVATVGAERESGSVDAMNRRRDEWNACSAASGA